MEICPKTKSTSRNSVDLLRIFILFRRSTDPLSSSLSLIVVFLFLFLVIDERREGKRYFWLPEPRGRYRLADRTPAPERNDDLRSLLMLLFARTLPESLHGFGCQRSGEEKLKYMSLTVVIIAFGCCRQTANGDPRENGPTSPFDGGSGGCFIPRSPPGPTGARE